MSNPWSFEHQAYLAANFARAPMADMIAATGRTMHAIYSKAKDMGLKRDNRGRIGHGRFLKGSPFRPGSRPWKTNVRDAIVKALAERTELTAKQLMAASGSGHSGVWKACDRLLKQGNIHVVRWQQVVNSPGNWEAVYRIGVGVSAEKPATGNRQHEQKEDPHEIQTVPRPKLGPWGLCWGNTTNAGNAPAERNTRRTATPTTHAGIVSAER